jgi:hypothetical protein
MDERPSVDLQWRVPLDPPPAYNVGLQVAIDHERQTMAWRAGWEEGPFVHLHDLATGSELGRVVCAPLEITATASGFVLLDHGWRPGAGEHLPLRVLVIAGLGDAVEVVDDIAVAPETHLTGVAPDGDRMLLFRQGRCELRRRSGSRADRVWNLWGSGVDWEGGCVWGTGTAEVSLSALDGSWSRRLEDTSSFPNVTSVGCGVLRLGFHGIVLFRPRGPLLTLLRPTSRWIADVSVGDGGRTVRSVLGWASRRFEVDLDAGRVLRQPRDIERRARLTPRVHSPVWHPAKDLVALRRREDRIDVMTTDGTPVTWLRSGGWPVGWLPGDDSLLITNGTSPDIFLERWRLVPPPGR